jgi:hypothetical protein
MCGEVGRLRSGIHYDWHAAIDLLNYHTDDEISLLVRQLVHLAAQRDPETMNAGADVELNDAPEARFVNPPVVIKWSNENWNDPVNWWQIHRSRLSLSRGTRPVETGR